MSGFEFSEADPNDEPQKFFVGWKFRGSELLDGIPLFFFFKSLFLFFFEFLGHVTIMVNILKYLPEILAIWPLWSLRISQEDVSAVRTNSRYLSPTM